jgi:hypothetical protein
MINTDNKEYTYGFGIMEYYNSDNKIKNISFHPSYSYNTKEMKPIYIMEKGIMIDKTEITTNKYLKYKHKYLLLKKIKNN